MNTETSLENELSRRQPNLMVQRIVRDDRTNQELTILPSRFLSQAQFLQKSTRYLTSRLEMQRFHHTCQTSGITSHRLSTQLNCSSRKNWKETPLAQHILEDNCSNVGDRNMPIEGHTLTAFSTITLEVSLHTWNTALRWMKILLITAL